MDHYAVLGVGYAASGGEIASAFRAQALRLHPDKLAAAAAGGKDAHANFLRLQQAYSVLRHAETREQYDAALKAGGLRFGGSSASAAGTLSFSEVPLDECDSDESTCCYFHHCRCGAELRVDEETLQRGIDLFPCSQCSLVYRLVWEWEPSEADDAATDTDVPAV